MKKKIALVALAAAAVGVQAADWSDTYMSFSHGNNFAEPYEYGNKIPKNIFSLTHVSGYKYGTNFFNVDMLDSAGKDAGSPTTTSTGAHEVYVIYRNTVDLSKVTGQSYKAPGVKGLGVTGGFDWNTKSDAGFNSKKEMLVLGPTAFVDVPAGFLNVSLLGLWESQSPYHANATTNGNPTPFGFDRYHYKPHASLSTNWNIPVSIGVPFEFEGVANYIARKGTLEDGVTDSKAETFVDLRLMYDMSAAVGAPAKTFKVGAEYQYWKNKFGNATSESIVYSDKAAGTQGQAGPGAKAHTPMIRAEYHF